jgi:uncharacterized protein (AIM24 family)
VARPVRTTIDEVSAVDEEFQLHLDRGAELLSRGEPDAARESLARAAELRRDDPKTLGLLGQALYRLGKFDEAAALFGKLVEQNPLEAGAQVNLGLANLRAKRYVEAISHLERALDLNPEHRKAMGYLGLAWLEHGNVARAREWFSRGGSDHMVARCDELLQAARRSAPPADPQWTVGTPAQAPKPAEDHARHVPPDDEAEIASAMRVLGDSPRREGSASAWDEDPAHKSSAGWKVAAITGTVPPWRCTDRAASLSAVSRESQPSSGAVADAGAQPDTVALTGAAAELTAATEAGDARGPAPQELAAVPAADADGASEAEPDIEVDVQPVVVEGANAAERDLVRERPRPITLEEIATGGIPAVEPPSAPTFSIDRGVMRIAVRGEVLARVSDMIAARGAVELAPEMRRYRGRGTDKLFGDGRDAIHRVRGEGALLIRARARRHTVVELSGSAGFFREDCVFGMEASISFDNARLTARAGPDVDLVQLRGDGAFVLVTRGDIAVVDVSETPLRIAASALIGWTGALTPRLTSLAEGDSSRDTRAVELTGEGRVLLDSGIADG